MEHIDQGRRFADIDENLGLTWKKLQSDGYVLLGDHDLGTAPGTREHIRDRYFNDRVLRRYETDMPADRKRARDVVEYTWNGSELSLREHAEIAIENRGGRPERREYDRTPVLRDRAFASWIRAALTLIPPAKRQTRGTFGINLFRTFTNVVTTPHKDGEQYIFVYVVDKVGTGAETTLFEPGADEPFLRQTLRPGELIVFEDDRFRHGATPLVDPPGGTAHRDALVCTVDYPDTYSLT